MIRSLYSRRGFVGLKISGLVVWLQIQVASRSCQSSSICKSERWPGDPKFALSTKFSDCLMQTATVFLEESIG